MSNYLTLSSGQYQIILSIKFCIYKKFTEHSESFDKEFWTYFYVIIEQTSATRIYIRDQDALKECLSKSYCKIT